MLFSSKMFRVLPVLHSNGESGSTWTYSIVAVQQSALLEACTIATLYVCIAM